MLNYFLGTVRIWLESSDSLNYLVKENIQCTDIEYMDNCIEFTVNLYNYRKVKRILERIGFVFKIKAVRGLPSYIIRYRKRWGIAAGALIFCIVSFVSSRYIWSFEITGNNTVADYEIISLLSELGCSVGSKISEIDFDMLHNDFLVKSDNISWISVNMDGTKAKVEVREAKKGSTDTSEKCNIIAKEDGQIDLITVVDGKAQVAIGDVVRKGDILISGVSTYREGEKNYYENADGAVFAVVNRSLFVEIEKEVEIKNYTGNKKENNVLKFFGFSINLFTNSRIQYPKYDTIVENRQIVLFDSIYLPVWIEKTIYSEYEVKKTELTESDARIKGIKEYRDRLAEITRNAELISIETEHSYEDGVYRIDCNLYCIADIAESAPFSIDKEDKEVLDDTEKD